MIPYGRQDISQADIDAVVDVLRSDFLTQGPVVPRFESAITAYCQAEYGVAVNSATSALHIACLAIGLGQGDWLWTSPITFVASANCGLYCGAKVDFVDIDPRTFNLCPKALEKKLAIAKTAGMLPKVVVAVHMCGQPCDMRAIHALSKLYEFKVIEDASHAIGGQYLGEPIGNCRYSDITVFSFHPVKIITTAEGGIAVTNQADLANRMALYRSHGITRERSQMSQESDGPWYYEQIGLGFNYRLTELQAALGLSQFGRLDQYVEQRHAIATQYNHQLEGLPVDIPWQHPDGYSAFHLYVVRLRLNQVKKTHREVFTALRELGIGVNLHYIPVYRQPYYRAMGLDAVNFPEAESYYSEAITLPLYPTLTSAEQQAVVAALSQVLVA